MTFNELGVHQINNHVTGFNQSNVSLCPQPIVLAAIMSLGEYDLLDFTTPGNGERGVSGVGIIPVGIIPFLLISPLASMCT